MSDNTNRPKARGTAEFLLTGFTHEKTFRVFAFDRIGEDRERTKCTVRTDLSLLTKYGIQIQELPLLCRGMLDRDEEEARPRSGVFGETEMRACADERAAVRRAALGRRRIPHKPTPVAPGVGWRADQPVLSHTGEQR